MSDALRLGTRTVWGTISAVGTIEGERYYWMTKGANSVAMMPGVVVEKMYGERGDPGSGGSERA